MSPDFAGQGNKKMTEEIKKAFQLAEKELEETKISKLKDIVKRTLEKIEKITKEKKNLEEMIKILKMDIDDLKVGRLDRIEERQRTSDVARATSMVKVEEKEVVSNPSQVHYIPYWQRVYMLTPTYCETYTYVGGTTSGNYCSGITVSSSDCSTNTCGTYNLSSGVIKYL